MTVKKVSVEASHLDHAGFTGIRVHTEIDGYTKQSEEEAILHELDVNRLVFDNAKSFTPVEFDVE